MSLLGADDRNRTGDLVLTKDALCQLSYIGSIENLERETGIEPATNSLEGCDSTTELLPPSPHPRAVRRSYSALPPALRPGPKRVWWAGEDSNLRRHKAGRFTVCCD